MTSKRISIATRKSALAMWQAEEVARRLQGIDSQLQVELVGMTTTGDRFLSAPLATQGGKGLFVKELESSMLAHETDLAVHSMKDVPYALPEGLMIAAILEREDPRDALVSNRISSIEQLPHGARVGTASTRRKYQLATLRPDLVIEPLRGNVNTRLSKLDQGEFEAIMLACAGLIRLGFSERITSYLDPEIHIPSIGQGAIGIECRSDDQRVRELLTQLHHEPTARCVHAERVISTRLQASCQLPIAAHGYFSDSRFTLRTWVGNPDAPDQSLTSTHSGHKVEEVTQAVLNELEEKGALRLVASLKHSLE